MQTKGVSVVANPSSPSSLIPAEQQRGIATLSNTLATAQADMVAAKDDSILKALIQAKAMKMLDQQLTPELMADVAYLQGSEIGFVTDRDKQGGYKVEEIKRPLIVAMLTGLRPTGNEFNIITGKCYATVNGLRRIVAEWPGLTDLRIELGVPASQGGGALVPVTATWRLDGVPMGIQCRKTEAEDTRIPVKVNSGMGSDAIHGKARRKMFARIVERLSGSAHSIATVGDDEQDAPVLPFAIEDVDTRPAATIPAATIENLDPREGATQEAHETPEFDGDAFIESVDFSKCRTLGNVKAVSDRLEDVLATAIANATLTPDDAQGLLVIVSTAAARRQQGIRDKRGPATNPKPASPHEMFDMDEATAAADV